MAKKIKLENELYEKVARISEELGYSSIDEFVSHVLEREVNPAGMEDNDEDVVNRLKGLGYIA